MAVDTASFPSKPVLAGKLAVNSNPRTKNYTTKLQRRDRLSL